MKIAKRSTCLIVPAHPDDEVLDAGGTTANHADAGDVVQVLILAEGATSRQEQRDRDEAATELSILAKAPQAAGRILDATAVELLSFLDNRLYSLDWTDLIKPMKQRIDLNRLQVAHTHHASEMNYVCDIHPGCSPAC